MRRTALVLTVLVLAGCSDKPAPSSPTAAPAPSTASSSSAAPSSPTAAPASSASGGAGVVSLSCSDRMDVAQALPEDFTNVLGAVGVNAASTLQTASTGGQGPHTLFAKTPLAVRAGQAATLTVPASTSVTWGNGPGNWTSTFHVPACAGTGWLIFPGGFSLDKPACVPLQVRTATTTATVSISIGTRCPGYRSGPIR